MTGMHSLPCRKLHSWCEIDRSSSSAKTGAFAMPFTSKDVIKLHPLFVSFPTSHEIKVSKIHIFNG